MSQTINGANPQVTQSGNIINCHPGFDCPTLRTGVVIATLGALCWWWLKTRPAAPEPPPGPLKKAG